MKSTSWSELKVPRNVVVVAPDDQFVGSAPYSYRALSIQLQRSTTDEINFTPPPTPTLRFPHSSLEMATTMAFSASTSSFRASQSQSAPMSYSDSPLTQLPAVDFNFDELRKRMADFTVKFDAFIERGRKRVLEERNGFRARLGELNGELLAGCERNTTRYSLMMQRSNDPKTHKSQHCSPLCRTTAISSHENKPRKTRCTRRSRTSSRTRQTSLRYATD